MTKVFIVDPLINELPSIAQLSISRMDALSNPINSNVKALKDIINYIKLNEIIIENLSKTIIKLDEYALYGYPLGKSWKGRKKWEKKYGRNA